MKARPQTSVAKIVWHAALAKNTIDALKELVQWQSLQPPLLLFLLKLGLFLFLAVQVAYVICYGGADTWYRVSVPFRHADCVLRELLEKVVPLTCRLIELEDSRGPTCL